MGVRQRHCKFIIGAKEETRTRTGISLCEKYLLKRQRIKTKLIDDETKMEIEDCWIRIVQRSEREQKEGNLTYVTVLCIVKVKRRRSIRFASEEG